MKNHKINYSLFILLIILPFIYLPYFICRLKIILAIHLYKDNSSDIKVVGIGSNAKRYIEVTA